MALGNTDDKTNPARKIKQYAASASVRNLVTDSIDGKTCARAVKILGAGSFTGAKDGSDTLVAAPTPGTLGPLAAGDMLEAPFSEIISTAADFIAYW